MSFGVFETKNVAMLTIHKAFIKSDVNLSGEMYLKQIHMIMVPVMKMTMVFTSNIFTPPLTSVGNFMLVKVRKYNIYTYDSIMENALTNPMEHTRSMTAISVTQADISPIRPEEAFNPNTDDI